MCEIKLKDGYSYEINVSDTLVTSIEMNVPVAAQEVKLFIFKQVDGNDTLFQFDEKTLGRVLEYWKSQNINANIVGAEIRTNEITKYDILDVVGFEPSQDTALYTVALLPKQYEKIKDCEEVTLCHVALRADVRYISIGFNEVIATNCFERQIQFIEDTLNNCLE